MKYKRPRKCLYHPILYNKGCFRCGYERPGWGSCSICGKRICTQCFLETQEKMK